MRRLAAGVVTLAFVVAWAARTLRPGRAEVYVGLKDDAVAVIDTSQNKSSHHDRGAQGPHGLVVTPTAARFVSATAPRP